MFDSSATVRFSRTNSFCGVRQLLRTCFRFHMNLNVHSLKNQVII